MLHSHEKIRIPDIARERDLVLEVNWNQKDPRTNECKAIRVHYPDGSMATIAKEHLHAFLFSIGTEEQQRQLIPQTTKRSRWYETTISVKAKKDIRQGEEITFPLKLSLPTLEQEVVAEMKTELAKQGISGLKNFN